MRVLVIEDERKLATVIRKALNEQGMRVEVGSDSEDALRMATATSYDVLLLDLDLAGIDGFEVCRRLRAQGVSAPILMLTAGDRIDERNPSIDPCPDDYMAKPFDFDELFGRVRALASRKSQ